MKALSKIIINNPSLIDISWIHLEWYLLGAINHFRNAKSDLPVEIADDIEIISPTETRVFYRIPSKKVESCEITTKMEDDKIIVTILKAKE